MRLVVRMQGEWNLLKIMSSYRVQNAVNVLGFAIITLATVDTLNIWMQSRATTDRHFT